MFTPEERDHLRSELLDCASRDQRIAGAAITGSAAEGREDRWSDIDLAFGLHHPADLAAALETWTSYMYQRYAALHHTDVHAGAWVYRVFLLASTLQVDLAFVPATDFRPLSPAFRLVFGTAGEPLPVQPPSAAATIGLSWLYALHARSCIARGRLWQAEYMISGMRDHALALACLRHGVPVVHGRGMDLLPSEVTARFEACLVRNLHAEELSRVFRLVTQQLLNEIRSVDNELATRLQPALTSLVG